MQKQSQFTVTLIYRRTVFTYCIRNL